MSDGPVQPFVVGASVRIEAVDERGELVTYRTRIEDVTEQAIVVQLPYEKGRPVRFAADETVVLLRQDDTRRVSYAATVKVLETRPGSVPLLLLSKPTDYDVVPRRRFFRCPVRLAVRVEGHAGEATNLSGSGVLVVLPAGDGWKVGTEYSLELQLPGEPDPLLLTGRAVRTNRLGTTKVAVAFDFVHLHEKVQDRIIRYLLVRQRELISRGLWVPEEPPEREAMQPQTPPNPAR